MESLHITKQTLQEFLDSPFGISHTVKNLQYADRYESYKKSNKIKIESALEYLDNYFIHVKVPSESQHGDSFYDVVVQFMPATEKNKSELSVKNYHVQFFSNSPGFMYKYASLYKLHGYLIETLFDKFQPGMLDVLPDKANKSYDLYFDSSIYYACRYLLDNQMFFLSKLNLKLRSRKSVENFFRDVQDTDTVQMNHDVHNLEISIKNEIHKDTELSHKQEKEIQKRNPFVYKEVLNKKEAKRARNSTFRNANDELQKKHAQKSTASGSSNRKVTAKGKKIASRSTKRPK